MTKARRHDQQGKDQEGWRYMPGQSPGSCCVPHPENPHHHRAGPGPYPQYPAARMWIGEWIQGGVDQMKGLSNVGAATRLQIRECAFWPCSISHHPRITHSRYAPFNGRYCGNGRSQVTMLQGSQSGIGSVSNGNPAEASDPPQKTC